MRVRALVVALAVMAVFCSTARAGVFHTPCRAKHSGVYCQVRDHRHAIRVVRGWERREARRAHVSFSRRAGPSWNLALLKRGNAWERRTYASLRALPTYVPRPVGVVESISVAARRFGFSPAGMIRIARCESGLDRTATNGQYLGLFQLGGFARGRYLHGFWTDAYENALAAARYAAEAGGFGPWSCGYAY